MASETTIDLRQLLALFKKHALSIVLSTVVLGILGWGIAKTLIIPEYIASIQVLASQPGDKNNAGAALQAQQAGVQVIDTYKDIIKNDVMMSAVQKNLANPTRLVSAAQPAKFRKLPNGTQKLIRKAKAAVYMPSGTPYHVSRGMLSQSVSISANSNSQVFAINVTDSNPDRAAAIANTTAQVFKAKIATMMAIDHVTIVSRASRPIAPVTPKVRQYVLGGLLLGFFLSISVILVQDMLDVTVRDETFLTQELGLTNLGMVSTIRLSERDCQRLATSASHSRRGK